MPRAFVLYPELLGSVRDCIFCFLHSQSFVHMQLSSSIVFDALSPLSHTYRPLLPARLLKPPLRLQRFLSSFFLHGV